MATVVSALCLLAAVFALFAPMRICATFFILCSPLTTVAVINTSNKSILVYQIMWLVFTFRILLQYGYKVTKINRGFVVFVAYCLLATLFTLLSTDVIVLNVDNEYALARVSLQQFTQWIYLFMAITSAIGISIILKYEIVTLDYLLKIIDCSVALVLVLGLLQVIIPIETVNETYRNAVHVGYNWDISRLSSTFNEPSMLSLFLTPMIGVYLVRIVKNGGLVNVILLLGSLALCLQNKSSSFIVGMIAIAVICCFWIFRILRDRLPYVGVLFVVFGLTAGIAFLIFGFGNDALDSLVNKLNGLNTSGVERGLAASVMMGVFLDHPLFGVGWGVARSYDLLTTWLAELGIIGFMLFLVPMVYCLILVYRKNTNLSRSVMLYIITALVIMFVSVPEPYYLPFWIIMGILFYLADDDFEYVADNRISVGKQVRRDCLIQRESKGLTH